MYTMKKTLLASAVMAMGMAVSGGAVAFDPPGPFQAVGEISVDNTGAGGAFNAFDCDLELTGHIGTGGTGRITGVWITNGGEGQIPAGCPAVNVEFLPWPVTVSGGTITINNVRFQAPGQPGCGDAMSGSTIVGAWSDGDIATGQRATVTFTNAAAGDCVINSGELKFRVHVGPEA